VHIAFLELVIDPVCSIVFEAEGDEANVMRRPPRDRDEPLFSWRTVAWSLFQGCAVLAVVIALFGGALNYGLPETEARALAFVALVLASLVMVLVNRATDASLFNAFRRPNPALWYVAGAAVMVLTLAVYVPSVRELFRFGPMHADDLAAAVISAMALLFLFEAIKLWLNGRLTRRSPSAL
jgi:Ca2+-transporting ATPase